MNKSVVSFIVFCLFIASCTPNMARIHQEEEPEKTVTPGKGDSVQSGADTVSYTIEFENSEEREAFLKYYKEHSKNKSSEQEKIDSTDNSVKIQISPSKKDSISNDTMSFSAVEQSQFVESAIEKAMESVDSLKDKDIDSLSMEIEPDTGGKVRIYTQRGFLDNTFSELVNAYPFGKKNQKNSDSVQAGLFLQPEQKQDTGIFIITDSSSRRLELQLAEKTKNADGQALTALDFIELWSRLIKNEPAEGLAIFKNVRGIEKFISGEEPLVKGFSAVDHKTVKIRFSKPDTLALTRMRTSRLLWGAFKLGPYYTAKKTENEIRLLKNENFQGETTPFLDECSVKLGEDENAVLSFSFGKYDVMSVNSLSDLQFARNDLADSTYIREIDSERYFLACRSEDPYIRSFLKNSIDPYDILADFVETEGEVIRSVENIQNRHPAQRQVRSNLQAPVSGNRFRIMYRKNDPVSEKIAEKLFADLTHSGMNCDILGADKRRYESALAQNDYECAVGWVSESVNENETSRLRYAEKWFSGETDTEKRLQENREIPLFSIKNYLLLKNDIQLHQDKISGLWIEKEKIEE